MRAAAAAARRGTAHKSPTGRRREESHEKDLSPPLAMAKITENETTTDQTAGTGTGTETETETETDWTGERPKSSVTCIHTSETFENVFLLFLTLVMLSLEGATD